MSLIEHPIVKAFVPLVLFLALAGWLDHSGPASRRIQKRAIESLRALGVAQAAYLQRSNSEYTGTWSFASFRSLKGAGSLPIGSSRENLINHYSLAVWWAPLPGDGQAPSYTVVALPQQKGLRTFAICDDQTLRVATTHELNIIPNRDDEEPKGDCPCYWEPVR